MISGFTQEYLNLIANNIGRQCKGQLDGQLLASQHKGEGLGLADAGDAGNFSQCTTDSTTINLFTLLNGNPDSGGTWAMLVNFDSVYFSAMLYGHALTLWRRRS